MSEALSLQRRWDLVPDAAWDYMLSHLRPADLSSVRCVEVPMQKALHVRECWHMHRSSDPSSSPFSPSRRAACKAWCRDVSRCLCMLQLHDPSGPLLEEAQATFPRLLLLEASCSSLHCSSELSPTVSGSLPELTPDAAASGNASPSGPPKSPHALSPPSLFRSLNRLKLNSCCGGDSQSCHVTQRLILHHSASLRHMELTSCILPASLAPLQVSR
jgi:hypothetical protein